MSVFQKRRSKRWPNGTANLMLSYAKLAQRGRETALARFRGAESPSRVDRSAGVG